MLRNNWLFVFTPFFLLASGTVCYAANTDTPLRDKVGVENVTGAEKAICDSKIGIEEFRRALLHSLDSTGLRARANCEARYLLSAVLESCSQPTAGYALTTVVHYTLTDTLTGIKIYQESLSAEYGVKAWDSLFMSRRSLTEASLRANIGMLTGKLFELSPLVHEASLLP